MYVSVDVVGERLIDQGSIFLIHSSASGAVKTCLGYPCTKWSLHWDDRNSHTLIRLVAWMALSEFIFFNNVILLPVQCLSYETINTHGKLWIYASHAYALYDPQNKFVYSEITNFKYCHC